MTTIEHITSLKPNRITDVLPVELFSHDAGTPEGKHFTLNDGNCYEWYYAIGKHYEPSSVLEIGVRYGYSLTALVAGAMASGENDVDYVMGIDNEEYVPGSLAVAEKNVRAICKCAYIVTFNDNSQDVFKLLETDPYEPQPWGIISIDGDHSEKGTRHDLNLTINQCLVVVVDDYFFIADVQRAVDRFVAAHDDMIAEWFTIRSFRGTAVIEYKS